MVIIGDLLSSDGGGSFFCGELLRFSGVFDLILSFLGPSLGDHFGDQARLGEIRGDLLGDDQGDLRGEPLGERYRGEILRGDILGDLSLDDPLLGDLGLLEREIRLLGDLGLLECEDLVLGLGEYLSGEYLGDLERSLLGDRRGLGDLDRDLGDLDHSLGDRERGDNLGDLPLGESFLSGDLRIGDRFGDLRGDSRGDRGRGDILGDRDEYLGGDFLGDLYLGISLNGFFNILTGDHLGGDLLGGDLRGDDFLHGRGFGDDDLRFEFGRGDGGFGSGLSAGAGVFETTGNSVLFLPLGLSFTSDST